MKKLLIFVIIVLIGVIIWQATRKGGGEVVEAPQGEETAKDEQNKAETRVVLEGEEERSIVESYEFLDIKVKYPSFKDSKISTEIKDFVEGEIRRFKAEISFEDFPVTERERIKESGYKYIFDGGYEIHEGEGISSIVLDFSTYTGGAHGGHYLKSLNYSSSGEILSIGSLFAPSSGYLSRLSELSRKKLHEALGENLGNWSEDGTAPVTDNFSTFYLTQDGMLNIIFQPYQVAPWSAGVPKVSIDLSAELADILNPNLF